MKRRKAPRKDNIPMEAFQSSQAAAYALSELLRDIRESRTLPAEIATGMMLMMHEKGSKEDMKNYRAICLLPHDSKYSPCAFSNESCHTWSGDARAPEPASDHPADARKHLPAGVERRIAAKAWSACRHNIYRFQSRFRQCQASIPDIVAEKLWMPRKVR